MLPSINLAADFNSQDPKKQIAALKSQMASLKDAIEDELNSISYFQLDGDLRKRIDGINDAVKASNENIEMVMGNLKANYATIASLDAAVARIGTIEAKYITADYVSANYASLGWVTALDAIVGNLNAKAITTDNLSAQSISASQITSGTISAARINTQNLFSSGQLASLKLWALMLNVDTIYADNRGHHVSWQYMSSLGKTVLVANDGGTSA